MTTFVINLKNLFKETEKLYEQLSFHKDEFDNIININFEEVTFEIRTFWVQFLDLIGKYRDQKDIYGNVMLSPYLYRYAEITYRNFARIEKIRLLGVGPDGQRTRFLIEDIANPYTITALRLIENIREINKSPAEVNFEKFLECGKRDAWGSDLEYLFGNEELPKYRYTWDKLTKLYFSPIPIYNDGEISEARIKKIEDSLKKGPFTKEELQKNIEETASVKKQIVERAVTEINKAETPVRWLSRQLGKVGNVVGISSNEFGEIEIEPKNVVTQFADKFSIGCLIKEALACIIPKDISCRDIFANLPPGELFNRIKTVFPAGSETLTQIENLIQDTLLGTETVRLTKNIKDLEAWVEEDQILLRETQVNSEKQNLEAKILEKQEQLSDLRSQLRKELQQKKQALGLQDEQINEFQNSGNIGAMLYAIEGANSLTVTNSIILALDTIIPIETICEAFINMVSLSGTPPFVNFEGLPSLDIAQPRPLNDLFSGLSFEISEAFIVALSQALLSMIQGILNDLISCDTIDNFISSILDESISNNSVEDTMSNLFESSAEQFRESYERNYDQFIDSISSKTANMFELSGSRGKIPVGIDQEGTREIFDRNADTAQSLQALAAAAGRNALGVSTQIVGLSRSLQESVKKSQNNWVIDTTGTKFEIEVGLQIFDLKEIDRYFESIRQEQGQILSDLDKFTPRALADAAGIEELEFSTQTQERAQVSGKVNLNPEQKEEIKNEMNCIMYNLTSILLPSQVLSLLAGNATEETKELAFQIVDFCETENLSIIFNNPRSFAGMLSSFGKLSGLSNLQDEVRVLIDSPDFQRQTSINKCEPFRSLEDFRQDLLSRAVPREKAVEVLNSLNRQRQERFNQISKQVIDLAEGKINTGPNLDPNSYLIQAIRAAKADSEMPEVESSSQETSSPNDVANNIAQDFMRNSPVINDMFDIVLDSIFIPIETTIKADLNSLGESFSDIEQVTEPVPRIIEISTGLIPPLDKVDVINPKFKSKIEAGLVPITFTPTDKFATMVDKSLLAEDAILPDFVINILKPGASDEEKETLKFLKYKVSDPNRDKDNNLLEEKYTISGDENSLYTRPSLENGLFSTLPPIGEKVNKKVVGSALKRNINSYNVNTNITQTIIGFELAGSLNEVEEKLLDKVNLGGELARIVESSKKSWEIKFSEILYQNNIVNNIDINTKGKTFTSINGNEDFYIPNFSYSKNIDIGDPIAQRLLRKYNTVDKKRKEVFDNIILKEFIKYIRQDETGEFSFVRSIFEANFSINSEQFFAQIMSNFVGTFTQGITQSKLLEPAAETPDGQKITKLELLDLAKCNDIMDMPEFRQEIKMLHSKITDQESTIRQRRGEEKRASKIAMATEMVLSNLFVKTVCLDFLLKVLPAYDYFGFSKQVVKNDMMINILCRFVDFELQRLEEAKKYTIAVRGRGQLFQIKQYISENIVKFYEIKKQQGVYREITEEERNKFRQGNFSYPIEMKPILEKHLDDLLDQLKQIVGVSERLGLESTNDFLKFIMENLTLLEVHGPDEGYRGYIENNINQDIVLERYIKFNKINKQSSTFMSIPDSLKDYAIELLEDSILSFEDASKIIKNIYDLVRKDFYLYVCEGQEGHENSFFETPYEFGLRLVNVKERQEKLDSERYGEFAIALNNALYPYDSLYVIKQKSGLIVESQTYFETFPIVKKHLAHNRTELVSIFTQTNLENKYNSEFLPRLKQLMIEDDETNLFFSYALPLQEIISILLIHSSLANNTKKMKYFLEPSKKKIQDMCEYIGRVGDARFSSERLRDIIDSQREERENVGNPAGPLNFEAIKLFHKTPIQILKSMAITTDPNIMLTDKVIAAVSTIHSVAQATENINAALPIHGENGDQPRDPIIIPKPFLPYSLISLALLPFPIFGGLIPAIPPLTSYNIASPIGPIFLALEPLLWDLPYYVEENKTALSENRNCTDQSEDE